MTSQEAIERLHQIVEEQQEYTRKEIFRNLEYDHEEADNILSEIIKEHVEDGNKIIEEYEKVDKWYA